MKKTKPALIALCGAICLALQISRAQVISPNPRFDIYAGGSFDYFRFSDTGGKVNGNAVGSPLFGFEADYEYTDYYSVGGGLMYKAYTQGVHIKGATFPNFEPVLQTLQIPVYLQIRSRGLKKVTAYAHIGGAVAFNLTYADSPLVTGSNMQINGSNISETTRTDFGLKKVFPLIFIGGGIEAHIGWRSRLGISVRRYFGFTEIMKVDVNYRVDGGGPFLAQQKYKGHFLMLAIHFRHPFSWAYHL